MKLAYRENSNAKKVYEDHDNPSIEEKHDGWMKMRSPEDSATLWMVQYYYHLGNLYKDRIDTKANIAIVCATISVFASIVNMALMLL